MSGPGRRNRGLAAAAATVLLALVACSSGDVGPLRPPPALKPLESTTTTVGPDYATVELAGVAGRRREAVTLGPGKAELTGTVTGPEGPVAGAVVQAERLVGDAAASGEVTTGPDGRWALSGILGGRFRVRAWRSPDLALLDPQVLFLEATESRHVGLAVNRFTGAFSASAIAPDPPVVGQPANLAFRVTQRTVDARGTVRTVPAVGVTAQLTGPGQWSIQSANPAGTSGSGSVEWRVTCLAPGSQPLTVTAGDWQFPLSLPGCVLPSPPAEEAPAPPPDPEAGAGP